MRKLISLGVLTILLSMLASPAVAGSVEDCEVLEEDGITKALYGLCIAYWGADNGRSQERILANYRKKMRPVDPGNRNGTGDPDMPGLVDDEVSCPCWTPESLADATLGLTGSFCTYADGILGWESAIYEANAVQVFAGELVALVGIAGTSCAISINGAQSSASTSPDQDEECRAGVIALQIDPVFGFPSCF